MRVRVCSPVPCGAHRGFATAVLRLMERAQGCCIRIIGSCAALTCAAQSAVLPRGLLPPLTRAPRWRIRRTQRTSLSHPPSLRGTIYQINICSRCTLHHCTVRSRGFATAVLHLAGAHWGGATALLIPARRAAGATRHTELPCAGSTQELPHLHYCYCAALTCAAQSAILPRGLLAHSPRGLAKSAQIPPRFAHFCALTHPSARAKLLNFR